MFKTLLDRWNSDSPLLFKKLQKVGLILAGVSAAIAASPIALPAIITSAAGYAAVAGATLTAVSKLTVSGEQ